MLRNKPAEFLILLENLEVGYLRALPSCGLCSGGPKAADLCPSLYQCSPGSRRLSNNLLLSRSFFSPPSINISGFLKRNSSRVAHSTSSGLSRFQHFKRMQSSSAPDQTKQGCAFPLRASSGCSAGGGGGGRQTEKATLQKSTNIRGLDSAGASRIAAPPALGPFPPAGSSALLPERFQELGTRSRHEEPRHLRLSTRRSRGRNPRGCFPSAGRSSAGGG